MRMRMRLRRRARAASVLGLALAKIAALPALAALAACGDLPRMPSSASIADDASAPYSPDASVKTDDAASETGVTDAAGDAPTAPTCDVRAYGAKGDGVTKDTAAIQAAVDACAGKEGVVRLEHGTFLSGMITLKSNVVLSIDTTATLKGTQDDADYPTTNPPTTNTQLKNCRKALIYAEHAHDIRIEGGGTIDGNGNTPKWIGPSQVHPEATRPMAIYTALSSRVTIQNVKVKDAAMWGIVNLEADDLAIRNVVVDSPLSGNRDGIDVVDCHHVVIENVTITSEDDSICIKSGSRRGVDDVVVRNAHIVRSIVANGLKFGTASYGSFSNVTFEDIVVENVDKAAMAIESVDGADISNITFRRITVHGAGTPIFILLGDRGTTPSNDVHKLGSIDGVVFQDITGDSMKYHWSSPLSGTKLADGVHKLKNLKFVNVHIANKGGLAAVPADPPEYVGQYPDPNLWGDMPAFGYFLRHADGVTFTNSTPTVSPADARRWLEQRDVTNVTIQ